MALQFTCDLQVQINQRLHAIKSKCPSLVRWLTHEHQASRQNGDSKGQIPLHVMVNDLESYQEKWQNIPFARVKWPFEIQLLNHQKQQKESVECLDLSYLGLNDQQLHHLVVEVIASSAILNQRICKLNLQGNHLVGPHFPCLLGMVNVLPRLHNVALEDNYSLNQELSYTFKQKGWEGVKLYMQHVRRTNITSFMTE